MTLMTPPGLRNADLAAVFNDDGQPLRVLNVHNHHVGPGGFEVFFEGVTDILRHHGHHVATFERNNSDIQTAFEKLSAFGSAIYSPSSRRAFEAVLRGERVDLVHLNNIWPLVSPSVIDACRDAGVPVVMSMQDYKLTCPAGQHLREGKVCEKCMNGREYWAAVHGCRNGRVWSTAYSVRNVVNRLRGPFHDGVTLYLPCTQFVADHLVRGGYDAAKMHVLPDFSDLPDGGEFESERRSPGTYVGYVGRISPEKGLPVLIEAARRTGLPVKIAGNHAGHAGAAARPAAGRGVRREAVARPASRTFTAGRGLTSCRACGTSASASSRPRRRGTATR